MLAMLCFQDRTEEDTRDTTEDTLETSAHHFHGDTWALL